MMVVYFLGMGVPGLVIAAASGGDLRAFLVMTLAPSVCTVPWTIPSRWARCSPRCTPSPPSPSSWWEAPRPLSLKRIWLPMPAANVPLFILAAHASGWPLDALLLVFSATRGWREPGSPCRSA